MEYAVLLIRRKRPFEGGEEMTSRLLFRFVLIMTTFILSSDTVCALTGGSEPLINALTADKDEIAMTSGGKVQFSLHAGIENQYRNYFLLGTLSGTSPGTLLPGGIATLPLNWDPFTDLTLAISNYPCFLGFNGALDSTGMSTATLDTCGSLPTVMVGMKMHFAFLLCNPFDFVSNATEIRIIHTVGWHYLSSFLNYAPDGLPDFDQRQDPNWQTPFLPGTHWSYCGPVAASNLLWWFDSKHSDPTGFPGDGLDDYPLVQRYYPATDDHSTDNVHPLIELVAYYTQTDQYFPGGTTVQGMVDGLTDWFIYTGLHESYTVSRIVKPNLVQIQEKVREDCGILLHLYGLELEEIKDGLWRHWIAVAGISEDGRIAISDPFRDVANPDSCGPDYTWHNDPNIVSHDIWHVKQGAGGFLYLEDYWGNGRILDAVVISEL